MHLFAGLFLACAGMMRVQAQQSWPLWEAYTHRFLDEQGRIIDRSAKDGTTSEGQAYAMFFALVDDDHAHFDKLLDWTQANLAAGDLAAHLPAWSWGKSDSGEWKPLDDNSASDADLWLVYTLLEAGRLWHEPRYEKLGRVLAAHMAKAEVVFVPKIGTTLAPGCKGFHADHDTYLLNPSYLPLPLLVGMSHIDPQGPWKSMLASLPAVLSQPGTRGFAMDWVSVARNDVQPAPSPAEFAQGNREVNAAGSYDAIRVYLWLGLADPATPGRHSLVAALPGMVDYLKTAPAPPLVVDGRGNVVHPDGPIGFSAALIPYLVASDANAAAKGQAERVKAAFDPASSLYGQRPEYYDQNLVLFSTAWTEQRYRFDREGKLRVKWK